MKGYSCTFDRENSASARIEGVDASYKDLVEVCGKVKNKKINAALDFLQKVASMEIPVLYKTYSKKLGHRRELGGKKGRYPQKAAYVVLKVLNSAIANGRLKGFDDMLISHIAANRKLEYPRLAAKGRRSRQSFATSRIEVVLKKLSELPEDKKVKKKQETREKSQQPQQPVSVPVKQTEAVAVSKEAKPPMEKPKGEVVASIANAAAPAVTKKEEEAKGKIQKPPKPKVKLKDLQNKNSSA